jgi:PadR family transcriptional regulator AphA
MPTGAASYRYVILGLLLRQPMSGYDIKRYLKSLDWLIGSPSSGSLYPVLRALLQDGYATVEVHPHESRPPRKIYSITEAGQEVLAEWIERPLAANAPLRAFLMRLVLADAHPAIAMISHLKKRRDQIATRQAAIEQTILTEAGAHQDIAWDYGLALANAEIAWLDSVLDRFVSGAQRQSTLEVAESDNTPVLV